MDLTLMHANSNYLIACVSLLKGTWSNSILFSSKANGNIGQENRWFYKAVTYMLTAWLLDDFPTPYTPPRITIITSNYWDIPPRFMQATPIATWHKRDCYTQFVYNCKPVISR